MSRDFRVKGISISSGLNKCAYHCRYCQIAEFKPVKYTFERFVKIVEKFIEYKEKNKLEEFDVSFWNGYSYDSHIKDFEKELNLYKRVGDWELKILLLGGLPHMNDVELKNWYIKRKNIGSEFATATYTGCKELHDYWNNKKGNFDFLLRAQKIAQEVGLANEQRILITKSSLNEMDKLLDILDETNINIRNRVAYPFFYSGLARKYEEERITMELLDKQSKRVQSIYRNDKDKWKSEKDWIEYALGNFSHYEEGSVDLTLTDKNIELIESMSCEEILINLTKRTQEAYKLAPSQEELALKYSDKNSEKVYMFLWDMEALWMDRYLKENPIQFERGLTHFGR